MDPVVTIAQTKGDAIGLPFGIAAAGFPGGTLDVINATFGEKPMRLNPKPRHIGTHQLVTLAPGSDEYMDTRAIFGEQSTRLIRVHVLYAS